METMINNTDTYLSYFIKWNNNTNFRILVLQMLEVDRLKNFIFYFSFALLITILRNARET